MHGFGMACRVWDHCLPVLLKENISVLMIDQRCCGQSDKDFSDVSINALGTDVVRICDHLGLNSLVLNGWSLGGAVAVDAAAKLGDRVAGLVLTGGATPRYTQAENFPHGGTAEDVAATVAALQADRPGFLQGLYFEGVFATEVEDIVKEWCWEMAVQESPAGDASLLELGTLDQRDLIQALPCPAIIVHGTEDGVVPFAIGQAAAEMLPAGELIEMKGCGHAPFLEDKDTYHQHLLNFVGRC
jgi:pimeloyl-ACP methyl ester carboxylesterase